MAVEVFDLGPLQRALGAASDDIKREVGELAARAACNVVTRMTSVYPVGPVHWRKGSRVGGGTLRGSLLSGPFGVLALLEDGSVVRKARAHAGHPTAPHIHFYEQGTEPRFDPTRRVKRGAHKGEPSPRGRSPAHTDRTFVKTAMQERQALRDAAQAILNRTRTLT